MPALKEAIAEHGALGLSATLSPLEDAFLRLVHDAGLPLPSTNVLVRASSWTPLGPRRQRMVVELDGWQHHHDRHAFEDDRERDATLTAAGWRVVRFTHRQVARGPDRVLGTLRRLGIR
jgi:hypothetical protein